MCPTPSSWGITKYGWLACLALYYVSEKAHQRSQPLETSIQYFWAQWIARVIVVSTWSHSISDIDIQFLPLYYTETSIIFSSQFPCNGETFRKALSRLKRDGFWKYTGQSLRTTAENLGWFIQNFVWKWFQLYKATFRIFVHTNCRKSRSTQKMIFQKALREVNTN